MRLIAEKELNGHWSCHREGFPEEAAGGPSYMLSVKRFCERHGLDMLGLSLVEKEPTRVVIRVREACPDCKGTGRYVGLNMVEECGTCRGSGRA